MGYVRNEADRNWPRKEGIYHIYICVYEEEDFLPEAINHPPKRVSSRRAGKRARDTSCASGRIRRRIYRDCDNVGMQNTESGRGGGGGIKITIKSDKPSGSSLATTRAAAPVRRFLFLLFSSRVVCVCDGVSLFLSFLRILSLFSLFLRLPDVAAPTAGKA